ncbi:MAG: hypothetical protein ACK5MA_03155 [Parachlamydiaceae bacterium]
MLPPVDSNSSSARTSFEGVKPSYSPQQKAVDSVMRDVDRTINPPKSLRLRLWSKIAPHISQGKAKFLSKLILNSHIVARDNVAPFAQWISSRYIGSISPDQIAKISPERMAQLDRHQIFAMTPQQINQLTPQQVASLSVWDFTMISGKVGDCVPLMQKRLELVREGFAKVNSQDYLQNPGKSAFEADMPRASFVKITEGEEVKLYKSHPSADRVVATFVDMLGGKATENLKKVLHQGFSHPYLSVMEKSFNDVEGATVNAFQTRSGQGGFDISVEEDRVVVKSITTWKLQRTQDIADGNEDFALECYTETVMTLPLEGLNVGDFSSASVMSKFIPKPPEREPPE